MIIPRTGSRRTRGNSCLDSADISRRMGIRGIICLESELHGTSLGKAVYYLMKQETYLRRYMEDGCLEIDNNRAERSIKPLVMSRKNFLFANHLSSTRSNAVVKRACLTKEALLLYNYCTP